MSKWLVKRTVTFNKKVLGLVFLGFFLLLLLFLCIHLYTSFFSSIDFFGIYVSMWCLIFGIIGIGFLCMYFGEKYVQGTLYINKYDIIFRRKIEKYTHQKITTTGILLLVIFLWGIPSILLYLQYWYLGYIEYIIPVMYVFFFLPFWIWLLKPIWVKLREPFQKDLR